MNVGAVMGLVDLAVKAEKAILELFERGDQLGDLLVHMGITVLLATVKNAESKVKFKAAFLKVYRAIQDAFAGDPDFQ